MRDYKKFMFFPQSKKYGKEKLKYKKKGPEKPKKELAVLIVEDNPADAVITQETLKECNIKKIHVEEYGEKAISYLEQETKHPDLIFLDIHLPDMEGHLVLEKIKQNKELTNTPVVMLTGSTEDFDIMDAYRLQADAYVTKPLCKYQLVEIIEKMSDLGFILTKPNYHNIYRKW